MYQNHLSSMHCGTLPRRRASISSGLKDLHSTNVSRFSGMRFVFQSPRRAAEGPRFAQNERGSKEDERHDQKAAGCRSFGKAGPQHQQNQQSRQQKIQCTAGKQKVKGASSHKAQPLSFLRAACCGFAKTLVSLYHIIGWLHPVCAAVNKR